MVNKIIIVLLLVLLLIVMGCCSGDDSDNIMATDSTHGICELIHMSYDFGQKNRRKLKEKLSVFCDNDEELACIVDGIIDFVEKLKDSNIEYLSAMDMDYNLVCDHYTINEWGNVDLCPEGKEIGMKSSLLFVIHNHPSNITFTVSCRCNVIFML